MNNLTRLAGKWNGKHNVIALRDQPKRIWRYTGLMYMLSQAGGAWKPGDFQRETRRE